MMLTILNRFLVWNSLAVFALALSLIPVHADQPRPVFSLDQLNYQPDNFFSSQGKEEVELIVNLIGIHALNGKKDLQFIRQLADVHGLKIAQSFRDELVFLRVSDDIKSAKDVMEMVTKLRENARESAGDSSLKIGLVYTRQTNGDVPSITTDQIIAGVSEGKSFEDLAATMEELGFPLIAPHPYLKSQGVFQAKDPGMVDLMLPSRKFVEDKIAAFAYPNFTALSWDTETLLNDTIFGNQWHLRNTGQSGGTVDADADLSHAWDITQGAAGTIIAIHENGGFDTTHPDLTPNLWANPGEIAGNNIDDDNNNWVDDTLGWDFQGCTALTSPGCGDNSPTPSTAAENHGTAVAGVAAARGGNMLGVSGSCPNCSLMLLRSGYVGNDFAKSIPFGYAQAEGALVVSNSWSSSGVYPTTTTAINAAATAGVSVVFAAGNVSGNNCTDPRVGNNNSVLSVSSSSNQDRKVVVSSIGNCVDILSPSHRGYNAADPLTGTLNITTTDRQGANGYNNNSPVNNCPTTEASPPPNNARDYTACFGGTSSATPLTAGVIGLIETVNNTITRTQIQNLLQDTADRIEDSVGAYSELNGFSAPGGGTPTHSNGRLNAFEAVRIAAPVTQGGKGGVDVFIRDNRLDWGNTEQPSNTVFEATRGFIPHWHSVDIKVDAPPHGTAPTTNADFEAFVDEDPIESAVNKVYVRVRNRGPVTAGNVTVKLHWAFAGTALPALPSDFWTTFPSDASDTTIWHPEPAQTVTNLAYSGASVAGTGSDAAQILTFDFNAPAIDPSAASPRHYCVLVVLDSPQDQVAEASFIPDTATPRNNNITHRNLALQDNDGDNFRDQLFVRNPYDKPIRTMVMVEAPEGWKFDTSNLPIGRPFPLDARSEKLLKYVIQPDKPETDGEVSFIQYNLDSKAPTVMGGFTVGFRGKSKKKDVRNISLADLRRFEALLPRLEKTLLRLEVLLPKLEQNSQ